MKPVLHDMMESNPAGLWELLLAAGAEKVLGPWEEGREPVETSYGWLPLAHRRSPSGADMAYYGLHYGDPSWGVSGTVEDNQPDTLGPREACDAYLRARGWVLIDVMEKAVPVVIVLKRHLWKDGACVNEGCVARQNTDSETYTCPVVAGSIGAPVPVRPMLPGLMTNGHSFKPDQEQCCNQGCETTRDVALVYDCPSELPF